jgi:hypothetical protein
VVREIPIPTPHADERLVPTTLKPCEEVNNGRVIILTRTVFEAGRDDCRVSKAARDTRGDDGERLGPSKPLAADCLSSGNSFLRTGTKLANDYLIEITS